MDATDQPLMLVDFVDEPSWKSSTGAIAPYKTSEYFGEFADARGKKFRLNFYFTTQVAVSKGNNLGSTIVVTVAPSDSAIVLDQKSLVALKKKVRDFCHRVADSKRPMHKVFGFRAWFLVPQDPDESTLDVVNQIFEQIRSGVLSKSSDIEVRREQFTSADEFQMLCRFLKNEIKARIMEASLEETLP